MSLGESTASVVAGGGSSRISAAQLARNLVSLNVSPKGTVNTLIKISTPTGIASALDTGPLAEQVAMRVRNGLTAYAMVINGSVAGAAGSVTQVGTGSGTVAVSLAPHRAITIKCSTGGTIGTAAFQFSLDGGATYSAPVTSVASAPWVYAVPGTFCTLSFAAATYVATKTNVIGIDGTVTPGAAWVGTVTQTSSPIDYYQVVATVVKGGALGTAVLGISLDNGRSSESNQLVPSGGVVVIPGTGLVLTCANAFVLGETYSFNTMPPGVSTSDINNAIAALKAVRGSQFTMIHVGTMPSSAAGAYSALSTVETAMQDAFNNYACDWNGMVECPVVGDIVSPSSSVIVDSADTDGVITAARGSDALRTALMSGTYPQTSPITGRHQLRPQGWFVASRYVDTDPRDDLSALQPFGALDVFTTGAALIGRDESATPGLDDAQINTLRTYRGRNGAYLSITAGGSGFKNLTVQPDWQDACALRVLNILVANLRVWGQDMLGQRYPTDPDGTLTARKAAALSSVIDTKAKRLLGLLPGGDFVLPQASSVTATVLKSSQIGNAPKRLDIAYTLQPLGFVSGVASSVFFSATISVTP